MKKKLLKLIPLFLVVVLTIASLAGCNSKSGNGDTTTDNKEQQSSKEEETEQESKIKDKKLSVLTVPAGASFPDGVSIDNNRWFEFIQKETGYELEWSVFIKGGSTGITYDEQLMMILASGNAPDLIQCAPSASILGSLIKYGGLTSLDDALELYGNNLEKTIPQEVLDSFMIDGKHWALCRYTGGSPIGTMVIRKDWLDELNLKVPKTLDEYYNVLKAFKKAKPEDTPLIVDTSYRFIHLAGAFGVYTGNKLGFYFDNGKATYPILTEKGKEFLRTMHKWYQEGLIDPEFLLDKEVMEKMIAGKGGMMHWNWVEKLRKTTLFEEKNPDAELIYIAPPIGDNGEQGYLAQPVTSMTWIVPKSSEDKVYAAIDFLDKCQNKEITDTISIGFEGEHYTKEGNDIKLDNDALGKVGYRGYYSRVILDMTWDEWWLKTQKNGEEIKGFAEEFKILNDIHNIPFNMEAVNKYSSELNIFVDDEIMRFIVEGFSDDEFNQLVEQFNSKGGKECLDELQEWYDNK